MSENQITAKRSLKSVSDFEQWLNEINLFAQEAQSELHEIAGILNVALADTSPRHPMPRTSSEQPQSSSADKAAHAPKDDDPLASLQQKLAQQLKATRTAAVLPSASPPAPVPANSPQRLPPGDSRPADDPRQRSY
jgi:hypothetical protein